MLLLNCTALYREVFGIYPTLTHIHIKIYRIGTVNITQCSSTAPQTTLSKKNDHKDEFAHL